MKRPIFSRRMLVAPKRMEAPVPGSEMLDHQENGVVLIPCRSTLAVLAPVSGGAVSGVAGSSGERPPASRTMSAFGVGASLGLLAMGRSQGEALMRGGPARILASTR
jgi:hypothetical protein